MLRSALLLVEEVDGVVVVVEGVVGVVEDGGEVVDAGSEKREKSGEEETEMMRYHYFGLLRKEHWLCLISSIQKWVDELCNNRIHNEKLWT